MYYTHQVTHTHRDVKFTGCSGYQQAWGSWADHLVWLVPGNTYLLEKVVVLEWSTEYWLRINNELVGPFNSVCFEDC